MLTSLPTRFAALSSILRSRAAREVENLILRHQIGIFQGPARKRPKLPPWDRLLWVWFSRIWNHWHSALAIVKTETVLAWHHAGFRLFWTRKVRRGQPGRPLISREVREVRVPSSLTAHTPEKLPLRFLAPVPVAGSRVRYERQAVLAVA